MRIIHGAPSGRANYVIWAMKEMGLDFEINPVNPFKGETKKPEYLALNPLGQVPTLEEDGFILWESMAINFYLAKNYGAKNNGGSLLWSDDPREEAEITQWSLFGCPVALLVQGPSSHPPRPGCLESYRPWPCRRAAVPPGPITRPPETDGPGPDHICPDVGRRNRG